MAGTRRSRVRLPSRSVTPKREPRPVDVRREHQSAIIERARALTAEGAQTADTIAGHHRRTLLAVGLIGGPTVRGVRCVVARFSSRESLRRHRKPGGGAVEQPTKKSVQLADGHTVIYTEVLSTTGIPFR